MLTFMAQIADQVRVYGNITNYMFNIIIHSQTKLTKSEVWLYFDPPTQII